MEWVSGDAKWETASLWTTVIPSEKVLTGDNAKEGKGPEKMANSACESEGRI